MCFKLVATYNIRATQALAHKFYSTYSRNTINNYASMICKYRDFSDSYSIA